MYSLTLEIVDVQHVVAGRDYTKALCEVVYDGARRRTQLLPITAGKVFWLERVMFNVNSPTHATKRVVARVLLDGDGVMTHEVGSASIDISGALAAPNEHCALNGVVGEKGTVLHLNARVTKVGDGLQTASTRRESHGVSVGTQTTVSSIATAKQGPTDAFDWAAMHDFDVDEARQQAALRGLHNPNRDGSATAAPQRHVAGAGLSLDMELIKRLRAAWPTDEIDGILAYCEVLKHEKEVAEAKLAQYHLERARECVHGLVHPGAAAAAATSPMRIAAAPVVPARGLAAGASPSQGRAASARSAIELSSPTKIVSRVERLRGASLSDADRQHLMANIDML